MVQTKKSSQILAFIASLLFTVLFVATQKPAKTPNLPPGWLMDYPPFRIAGNLYYVGTYELGCYLITTPKGDILINTGTAESVRMIQAHVARLGFKFSAIKIMLTNQAHYDHVGGMAAVKKLTGAKMMINENDASVLADGGNSDYAFGGKGSLFMPLKADRLLHRHDTVKFGGMQLIVLHHPGHTKGSCSFLFDVQDKSRVYRVLIANMPTVVVDHAKLLGTPGYPNVAKDYAYTFDAMKKLQFDIWLAPHASQFYLQKKHKPGDAYNPQAFNDRKGYDTELDELHAAYLKKLNKS